MPQVTVTQYVKDQLNDIQTDEQHTSIDSVIRMLLIRSHTIDDLKTDVAELRKVQSTSPHKQENILIR